VEGRGRYGTDAAGVDGIREVRTRWPEINFTTDTLTIFSTTATARH